MITFRRHLPHYHAVDRAVFLTWRLNGSLPRGRSFAKDLDSGEAFLFMDTLLDNARTGPMYLRNPQIADMVVNALQYASDELRQYDLHAYVVMANHVHLLVTPSVPVSKLTHTLKRFTARQANRILNLTGQRFWQEESYDRVVRDAAEFRRILRYIEFNPVKAGLVVTPEEFCWSSARRIENPPQAASLPHKQADTLLLKT